jgi:hypothetical protein
LNSNNDKINRLNKKEPESYKKKKEKENEDFNNNTKYNKSNYNNYNNNYNNKNYQNNFHSNQNDSRYSVSNISSYTINSNNIDYASDKNDSTRENYLVMNTIDSEVNLRKNRRTTFNSETNDVIDKKQKIELENIVKKQKEAKINIKKLKLEKFMMEIELKDDNVIPSSFNTQTLGGNANEKEKEENKPCCSENECLIY